MKLPGLFLAAWLLAMTGCNSVTDHKETSNAEIKKTDTAAIKDSMTPIDLSRYYDSIHLEGLFVLYNPKKAKYIVYNQSLFDQPVTPASTFNIITALVALEENVLANENSLIKWNGMRTKNPDANKDIALAMAFRHNIDWFFWELRKKIGNKMGGWLKKIQYGNYSGTGEMDSTNNVDTFLVVPPLLRVTPQQQLKFMERLYNDDLPFSKHNTSIVKELMYEKEISGSGIYGKRGSYRLRKENKYIGWFAGYIAGKTETWFFVHYIQSTDLHHPGIVSAQKDLFFKIIEDPAIRKLIE